VLILASGHALAAAIPAGLVACGLTYATSRVLTSNFGEYLESLTIIPSNPFAVGLPVFAAVMLASILLAILPAWLFALPIMAARPVTLLSEKSL
jgi:hypothetical protein